MKMLTMWKDYSDMVLVPCKDWFKRYWKEYLIWTLAFYLVVWMYYSILFSRTFKY